MQMAPVQVQRQTHVNIYHLAGATSHSIPMCSRMTWVAQCRQRGQHSPPSCCSLGSRMGLSSTMPCHGHTAGLLSLAQLCTAHCPQSSLLVALQLYQQPCCIPATPAPAATAPHQLCHPTSSVLCNAPSQKSISQLIPRPLPSVSQHQQSPGGGSLPSQPSLQPTGPCLLSAHVSKPGCKRQEKVLKGFNAQRLGYCVTPKQITKLLMHSFPSVLMAIEPSQLSKLGGPFRFKEALSSVQQCLHVLQARIP